MIAVGLPPPGLVEPLVGVFLPAGRVSAAVTGRGVSGALHAVGGGHARRLGVVGGGVLPFARRRCDERSLNRLSAVLQRPPSAVPLLRDVSLLDQRWHREVVEVLAS